MRNENLHRVLVVVLVAGLAGATAAVAAEPKAPTGPMASAPAVYAPPAEAIVLDEGFETAVPPTGWALVATHTLEETWYQEDFTPHAGTYYASVQYDPDLVPQDEWLVSPAYDLAAATTTLSMWTNGSVYWCRDTFDNCDLEIWLVVGGVGGGDDILLGTVDSDWTASFTWTQSTFDLTSYAPISASIGFRYVGTDGAQISLDAVTLDGVLVPVELQSFVVD